MGAEAALGEAEAEFDADAEFEPEGDEVPEIPDGMDAGELEDSEERRLEIKTTEAMTVGVADTEDQSFAAVSVNQILELAAERDVVAIGPGVGQHPESGAAMREIAKRLD